MEPAVANKIQVDDTAFVNLLVVNDAHRGHDYMFAVDGHDIDWQITVDGSCGAAVVASGTIPATRTTVRTALPTRSPGGRTVRLQVKLTAPGPAVLVNGDGTWIPSFQDPTHQPSDWHRSST